ncbi:Lamin Tail Domain protein [uncultured archaeon]|nr:Lamin Tail Domain protein [uncultured archaeon]
MVRFLNWKYLTIWIAVIFSISGSFAQSVSTSETPSQGGFIAGIVQTTPIGETPSQGAFRVGLNQTNSIAPTPSQGGFEAGIVQTTPTTETPSQGAFVVGVNQTTSTGETLTQVNYTGSTVRNDLTILKVIKESDALHVIVANNGTGPVNLTDWKLALNNGSSTYLFPNFMLKPMSTVTVHTHMDANTPTDLYGSNFTWNGTRDVELIDRMGEMVSEYSLHTSSMNASSA